MYMDRYCPGLGIGVEPHSTPDIRYLSYNEKWDHAPLPEDILEFEEVFK
jgi:hypothetical protein